MLIVATGSPDGHDTGAGHPEQPQRVPAALAGLDDAGLADAVMVIEPRQATTEELARVHDRDYLLRLEAFCAAGGGDLDPDTPTVSTSWSAARYAAGGGLAVLDALRRDEGVAGFVAMRPPGHHAVADRAMGFCLLNNVAVAARALTDLGERVVIIDWDVHHGNGTQAIFWDDPAVLYVSTHEFPLYPGTGRATETGGRNAPKCTLNVPLPAGATGDVLLRAMDDVVAPAVERFGPTWVLVSAGFDAHRNDPLASLALSSGDFADLARRVREFSPRSNRLALFLEGGYDLVALRDSVGAAVAAVLDQSYRPEAATSGGPGAEAVSAARRIQLEPGEGDAW